MNENFFEEIFDSIKIIVNQELSNKLLPLSIEGVIIEKINNKQYLLDYNNVKITVYPLATTEYQIGDHVIVLLADGQLNGENKYILGKTDYRENIQDALSKTIQEQIDDIKMDIDNISQDNKITIDEKLSIKENWNNIISNYDSLLENLIRLELDTSTIEQAFTEYKDFVFNKILKDMTINTELTEEERKQWANLSQKYFTIFTEKTNEVNKLDKQEIYSVNIVSDKGFMSKIDTTFNFSVQLFKNGFEEKLEDKKIEWYSSDMKIGEEGVLIYNYTLSQQPIDISAKLYINNNLICEDQKFIYSYKDGLDGVQGPQGIPGKPGRDGTTYYTHIAYADDENGGGFSQEPKNKDYIGIAVNTKPLDDDTTIDEYEWSLIKGAQGVQGIPGKNGNFTHFAYMNTPDNSDNSFTTSVNAQNEVNNYIYLGQYTDKVEEDSQKWQDYIWTKIKGEKGDKGLQGIPGEQGVQGPKGDNGKSSYTHIAYSNSSDGSIDFSTVDYENKEFIGVLVDENIEDSQNYQDYQWSKIKGEKGEQGVPGKNGIDGRTTYFHTAFANSSDGSVDFSTIDYENKEYLGQYTDFVEEDSQNYQDYQWTKIQGEPVQFFIQGDTLYESDDLAPHTFTGNLIIGQNQINTVQFDWFLNDTQLNSGTSVQLLRAEVSDGDVLKCTYKTYATKATMKLILGAQTVRDEMEQQTVELNKKINLVATTGSNLFPYGGKFEEDIDFSEIVAGGSISATVESNNWKNNVNATDKCWVLRKNSSGDGWLNLKEDNSTFTVHSGEKFTIDLDYLKNMDDGLPELSLAFFNKDGARLSKQSIVMKENTGINWLHKSLDIEAPQDTVKGKIVIGITNISQKTTVYLDNITIKRVNITKTEVDIGLKGVEASVEDSEERTLAKLGLVGDKIQAQALQIGPYYPNGSFVDKTYANWYENTGGSGTTSTVYTSSDYLRLISTTGNEAGALIKDYIAIDPNKPINLEYKSYYVGEKNNCKFKVYEYNDKKDKVKETEYIAIDGGHLSGKWKDKTKRTFNVDKTLKTKYIRIEWIVLQSGNEMRVSSIVLTNGQGNLGATLSMVPGQIDAAVSGLESQINMIVDTDGDGNSDSYFTLNGNTVEVGAKYGFNIKANTVVEDGFELSADNISTGTIYGPTPSWVNADYSDVSWMYIPDAFKNEKTKKYYMPQLKMDEGTLGSTGEKLQQFSGLHLIDTTPIPYTSSSKGYIYRQSIDLDENGLSSGYYYWNGDDISKTLYESKKSTVSGYWRQDSPQTSGLKITIPQEDVINEDGTAQKSQVEVVYSSNIAYDEYNKYDSNAAPAIFGADGKSPKSTSLIVKTIYAGRIQSLNDTSTSSITIDDKLNCTETIMGTHASFTGNIELDGVLRSKKNPESYISIPDSYNIVLKTKAGGNSKIWFRLNSSGNKVSGTSSTYNHGLDLDGPGYILCVNGQAGETGGTGQIAARKFITTSTKEAKTNIHNANLEQAAKDFLCITPKIFNYKSEQEKYDEWVEKGCPEGSVKEFDIDSIKQKHIGFIVEDFLKYDSLEPFIAKQTDELQTEQMVGLDYGKLTPLLLAVCQNQQKEINNLTIQLSDLQEKLNDFLISTKG